MLAADPDDATEVIDLTRQLVGIDSQNPGPGESQIATFVITWCRRHGLESRVLEFERGRPNVIVTVDHDGSRHLGLAGHLDTKPIGDAAWRTDPFRLTIADGKAYGLGAADMKGAVAAMLLAARDFGRSSTAGRLSVLLTADEEQGSRAGAQALVDSDSLPALDALVIGEPSGIDRPWEGLFTGSRGICCFWIDIVTTQGHSGLSPRYGRNANLVAADLLTAFETFVPPTPVLREGGGSPTVNSGMIIEGGVTFGVWPSHSRVGIEIRTTPGMDRKRVLEAAAAHAQRAAGTHAAITIRPVSGPAAWVDAVELASADPLVDLVQESAVAVLGRRLPLAQYPGGTEALHFMGKALIPTISSLGPGLLTVAHGADEKVGLDDLRQAQRLYTDLTHRFPAA